MAEYKIYKDSENVSYIQKQINKYVFHPRNRSIQKPEWIKYLRISDKIIISYFSLDPFDSIDKKYILYSHGNGSDIYDYYSDMVKWWEYMDKKIGIIMYDYQGFGWSTGICTEKNTYNDLTNMVKFCLNDLKIKESNLFLVGQSLGTGVVVNFCCDNNWKTPICLISPYKSICKIVHDHLKYKFLSGILSLFDMYMTQNKLKNIMCKILIYHGNLDPLIFSNHSIDMYNDNKEKIKLILNNATHNDILDKFIPIDMIQLLDNFTI
jgi:pimeloyl-ACP methyl ester carboxylesterase